MITGLKSYPRYKESGLPWVGQMPEHWNARRTKTLFENRVQKGFPNEALLASTQTKGVVRKEDYGSRTVTAQKDLHLLKLVEVGDYVISLRSFQGGFEYAYCRGIISPAYTVLKPKKLATEYYRHFFKSPQFVDSLTLFVTGIREGQNIDYERFSRAELPVPPPEEQEAIVRFLDHANAKIDRYVRAKKKLIGLLNEQKQAIIHRAVTRGLNPDVHLKDSCVDWLGEIPEHWEVRRVKQLCSKIVDCKNRTPDQIDNGGYTVVRTTNIRNGKFTAEGSYQTDQRNYEIWTERGAPEIGDVFFTREAPVGEACLVPGIKNLCMGQRMMYFRPIPSKLNSDYLLFSIYGPVVRTYIDHAVNGSTVGHLRIGQVGAIPFLWCPVDEQKMIVQHINDEFVPLNAAITRTEREIELLNEYRTKLTADVVTGKLDVRAAAHLPALEASPELDLSGLDEEEELLEDEA